MWQWLRNFFSLFVPTSLQEHLVTGKKGQEAMVSRLFHETDVIQVEMRGDDCCIVRMDHETYSRLRQKYAALSFTPNQPMDYGQPHGHAFQ
ncbi:MAG: hypothetical protein WCO52_03795 [bacterium]